MSQVTPRKLLGLGAMLGVGIVLGLLPSGPFPTQLTFGEQQIFVPRVLTILPTFLPFAIGAYVARNQFLPIAVSFSLAVWIFGQYVLYQIALPAGQADILKIAIGNIPSLFVFLVAAVIGTAVGEWQYKRGLENVASAT